MREQPALNLITAAVEDSRGKRKRAKAEVSADLLSEVLVVVGTTNEVGEFGIKEVLAREALLVDEVGQRLVYAGKSGPVSIRSTDADGWGFLRAVRDAETRKSGGEVEWTARIGPQNFTTT